MIWCYFSSSICRKDLWYQCHGQIWALCHLAWISILCSKELHPPAPSWFVRMSIWGHPELINTSLCFSWRQLGGWTCWQGHHQAAPPVHHRHHPQQVPDPENLHVSNHHHQWNPLCLLEGGEGNPHSDLVSIRVDGAQNEGRRRTWGLFWKDTRTFWNPFRGDQCGQRAESAGSGPSSAPASFCYLSFGPSNLEWETSYLMWHQYFKRLFTCRFPFSQQKMPSTMDSCW